jgi:hypothetical protein
MRCPFPGMDPYLEDPALWPDVHNRLVGAIADTLSPALRPRYYVALEARTYAFREDDHDLMLVGVPDVSVVKRDDPHRGAPRREKKVAVLDVEVPMRHEVEETYIEVRAAGSGQVVTVLEVLSPANKVHPRGREDYEAKREGIFRTRTHLVEVDLLRSGDPMPVHPKRAGRGEYSILVSRGTIRPRGQLHVFGVREPIPRFRLPLLAGDDEPEVDLSRILHELYDRASFDLRLDYSRPSVPPLGPDDAAWAGEQVRRAAGS